MSLAEQQPLQPVNAEVEALNQVMPSAYELSVLSSEEGSTRAGVVIGAGLALGAMVAAYGLMKGGFLPSIGKETSVKAEPAAVTRVFKLQEDCYAGYDVRTASTAKVQARVKSGKLLKYASLGFDAALPGAWVSDRVSGLVETTVCQDSADLTAVYSRGGKATSGGKVTTPSTLDVSVPYSALHYKPQILVDTRETYSDQGFAMVGAKNLTIVLKVFTDKGIARSADELDSALSTIAEEQNYDTAVKSCGPIVESEIENDFVDENKTRFLADAQVFGSDLALENIHVHFTGDKPLYTNTATHLLDVIKEDKHFTVSNDTSSDCSLSPTLQQQRAEALSAIPATERN